MSDTTKLAKIGCLGLTYESISVQGVRKPSVPDSICKLFFFVFFFVTLIPTYNNQIEINLLSWIL